MKPIENIVIKKFDTVNSGLIENMPYVLEDKKDRSRQIATLCSCDDLHLVFSVWDKNGKANGGPVKTIVLSPMDIDNINIYKADLYDGAWFIIKDDPVVGISTSVDIPEEKMKEIRDAVNNSRNPVILNQNFNSLVTGVLNEENCPPTSTIVCHRVIDYKNQKCDGSWLTTGIDNFYKVDTESGVTVIRQFLYKVTPVKDADNDQVQYEIMMPVSESDKKRYMDSGWKIHPMFYNKDNGCYMPSVVIKERHVMDFTHREEDSITIQILSGIQLLYLIEFGLNQNPNLGSSMYAGIQYEDGYIVISNAHVDEKNQLVIDDEIQPLLVYSDIGYISRFMYWSDKYDWLFFPKETTEHPTLTDSFFTGPSRNQKNIILWGDENLNAINGIFRLWMNSTSTDGDEYIVPWEFGEVYDA
jgi:hypothetical protein